MEPGQAIWVLRPDFDRMCWAVTGPHQYIGPSRLPLDGHATIEYRDAELEAGRLVRKDRAFTSSAEAKIEWVQMLSLQLEGIRREIDQFLKPV